MASSVRTGAGNGSRARFKTGGTISIMATRPIRLRTISPMRVRKPTRIDAIPNFAQPAGNNRLIPQRVGWIAIFSQKVGERHRTIEIDHRSARSCCRSCKISLSFITGFRAGNSFPSDSGGLIHPCRTASRRSASETNGLRPGAGGPSSATTRSRSVTKTVFTSGREPDVLAELVFEQLDADRPHDDKVATSSYLVISEERYK